MCHQSRAMYFGPRPDEKSTHPASIARELDTCQRIANAWRELAEEQAVLLSSSVESSGIAKARKKLKELGQDTEKVDRQSESGF